ncbi:unnamed protein product [Echinostoma caproni]|uniref:WD_REPEATS_REGION domain-containing protein n=1 Tax=Echinostoma caproni TaxID=27848 RepID=A0A183AEL3_9TREM|nr:unnamed protein product [Echinostoma caproni]
MRTDVTLARYVHPYLGVGMDPETVGQIQIDESHRANTAAVCDLAVSNSGRLIITGCRNSTVYYWDLIQPNGCLHHETEVGPVVRLAMSNKKTALLMMTWDEKSRIRIMRPR